MTTQPVNEGRHISLSVVVRSPLKSVNQLIDTACPICKPILTPAVAISRKSSPDGSSSSIRIIRLGSTSTRRRANPNGHSESRRRRSRIIRRLQGAPSALGKNRLTTRLQARPRRLARRPTTVTPTKRPRIARHRRFSRPHRTTANSNRHLPSNTNSSRLSSSSDPVAVASLESCKASCRARWVHPEAEWVWVAEVTASNSNTVDIRNKDTVDTRNKAMAAILSRATVE